MSTKDKGFLGLVIDLSKGKLNTAKLVKKPVQVRGKDGKVHTRMQWVRPGEDMPVDKPHALADTPDTSKKKTPVFKNPYTRIQEELQEHRQKISSSVSEDVKDRVKDFIGSFKKTPEDLYEMMRHLKVIGDDDVDPRTLPELSQKDGNGMGPIVHMRNMQSLKKKLHENPELLDNLGKFKKDAPAPTPSAKVAEKPKSKAQQGGNSIKGILDKMSREEKYELLSRLKIADIDPLNVPGWTKEDGDGTAPIRHMKNMMALKKAIETDPSILNVTAEDLVDPDEEARKAGLDTQDKVKDDVSEFLKKASKELKLQWAKSFEDHEHMKNRIKSENENVSYMHKMGALKKIIMDNPDLMNGDLKGEFDKEQLMNLKIGNKDMQKILIHAVGLKGVGDVKVAEKGVEWTFGASSFVRIDEENGVPILSIVDTGKDGEGWDETTFPMEKVKEFLDKLRSDGEKAKIAPVETPLHRKLPSDIWKAFQEDFDKNYTQEAANVVIPMIHDMWVANNHEGSLAPIAKSLGIDMDTVVNLVERNGVNARRNSIKGRIDTDSESWQKFAMSHLVQKELNGDANKLIKKWTDQKAALRVTSTWLLHESAKHWTPEERTKARKQIISNNVEMVGDYSSGAMSHEDVKTKITDHLHSSLEFVPFDLMTDVIAHGCRFNFRKMGLNGKPHRGNYYSPGMKEIFFEPRYLTDTKALNTTHPMDHLPSPVDLGGGRTLHSHPFLDTASHEFAHAIDHYLTGHEGFAKWTNEKYSGSDPHVVLTSYANAVARSNPDKILGASKNGNTEYVYHKDEWMSMYEGRVYNSNYYNENTKHMVMTAHEAGGKTVLKDSGWHTQDTGRGLEHFSENTSRFANGMSMYRKWQEDTGDNSLSLKEWASEMSGQFKSLGYGDDSNHGEEHKSDYGTTVLTSYLKNASQGIKDHPVEGYGYLINRMSEVHPELYTAMHEIFGRPDFVGDTKTPSMQESFENEDYTRKSEKLDLVINL